MLPFFMTLDAPVSMTPLLAQAAGEGGQGGGEPPFPFWMPLVIIGVLFYLILWRPEQRRRSELQKMLSNLKKNDRVLTAGGLVGTVINAPEGSEEVTLRIDENSNTRVRVVRSAITRVLASEPHSDGSPKEGQGV